MLTQQVDVNRTLWLKGRAARHNSLIITDHPNQNAPEHSLDIQPPMSSPASAHPPNELLKMDLLSKLTGDFLATSIEVWKHDIGNLYRSINWEKDWWWLGILVCFFVQYFFALSCLRLEATTLFALFAANAAVSSLVLPWANGELRQNWRTLGLGDNYFDEDGFFLTLICGAPLVLLNVVILIKIVFRTGSLMVKVKRKQLLAAARRSRAEEAENNVEGRRAPVEEEQHRTAGHQDGRSTTEGRGEDGDGRGGSSAAGGGGPRDGVGARKRRGA